MSNSRHYPAREREQPIVSREKSKSGIFYGWWIVLAAFIAHALSGGLYFYGFNNFFMPLVREFGWSRAAVSGAFSLSRLEGGLLGPVGGFLVDRFGPRKMMILGVILMGSGFILFSRINSLTTFYLVFVLFIALGTTLGIHQAIVVSIANWFIKKRGTAMGIGLSGVGLGGLLVPGMAWLIIELGWRPAAVITGFIVWGIGIPVAMVIRHRPEQYGYLPDGESPEESVAPGESETSRQDGLLATTLAEEKVSDGDISFTIRQAMRTRVFWLLTLVFGLRQMAISAVVIHQIPFLIDLGVSPELAATMLGSIALISVVGRMGFGRLADIIEKRYVMAICLAMVAAGCLILANAQTLWQVIPFLVIYPPGYGGGAILMHAIRGEYFGRHNFGTITGFMTLVQMFGVVLGPVFAGLVYDNTGSYRLAFTTFAIVASVAMVLVLMARRPVLIPDAV